MVIKLLVKITVGGGPPSPPHPSPPGVGVARPARRAAHCASEQGWRMFRWAGEQGYSCGECRKFPVRVGSRGFPDSRGGGRGGAQLLTSFGSRLRTETPLRGGEESPVRALPAPHSILTGVLDWGLG